MPGSSGKDSEAYQVCCNENGSCLQTSRVPHSRESEWISSVTSAADSWLSVICQKIELCSDLLDYGACRLAGCSEATCLLIGKFSLMYRKRIPRSGSRWQPDTESVSIGVLLQECFLCWLYVAGHLKSWAKFSHGWWPGPDNAPDKCNTPK